MPSNIRESLEIDLLIIGIVLFLNVTQRFLFSSTQSTYGWIVLKSFLAII